MTADSATHNIDRSRQRGRPGHYRPAFLPGLGAATILFVAVYWLFLAMRLQAVDLNQPPAWWLVQVEAFPLLAFVPTQFVAFLTAAFSWRVFRHILIPGLLGVWLAGQVATGFMRSFYNFRTEAEAGSFLSRLQQHRSDRGPTPPSRKPSLRRGGRVTVTSDTDESTTQSATTERTTQSSSQPAGRSRMKPALTVTLITLPFAFTFILLIFFSAFMPPSPTRSAIYSTLIIIMGAVWIGIVGYYVLNTFTGGPSGAPGLALQRESLQQLRQEQALLRVGGPGRIVVPNSDVVVTEYNGHFCRVLGPGAQMLLPFEYVRSMLDLRAHDREADVTGVTQDGVELTCNMAVTFRLSNDDRFFSAEDELNQAPQQESQRPTRDRPYPYGEKAVRAAAYAESVDGSGRVSTWTSLPLIVATGQLRRALAENRLDALFDPEAREPAPHPELLKWVQDNTRHTLRQSGIELITLRMGPLRPPDAVTSQNLSGWRSYWEKEQRKRQAEGRAAAVSTIEEARTQAEVEMLRAIVEGIQRARRESSAELAQEIVALRLVEALERVAHSAQQVVIDEDTVEESEKVLEQLAALRRGLLPPASAESSEG